MRKYINRRLPPGTLDSPAEKVLKRIAQEKAGLLPKPFEPAATTPVRPSVTAPLDVVEKTLDRIISKAGL